MTTMTTTARLRENTMYMVIVFGVWFVRVRWSRSSVTDIRVAVCRNEKVNADLKVLNTPVSI